MERKTPLYDVHVEEGGKIVPFAGYLLPVQYGTGVIQEHMAVRQQAGLFDVSHMGEILFTGPTALDTINHLLTNDYNGMAVNKVRYGAMCNADGGTIDDLVVYKFGEERYLAVVNAANREKDYAHMAANVLPGTQCQDISDTVAQLALQGPKAPAILKKLLPEDQIPKGYYTALPKVNLAGMECMISRTGYTGELGYEIYTANENAPLCGRSSGPPGRSSASSPAAWAPGTPSGWRPPCPSTATRWTRPSPPWRPAWTVR